MLGAAGFGKRGGIVRGIGCAPHHAIDGEQLQSGPAGMIGLLVSACCGLVKQPLNALVAKLLASLQEGAGGDKGAVAGQEDIELIDQLGHGDVAEDGHADNGPDQTLHGHTAATQGRDILFGEQRRDELVGNEVGE